MDACARGQAWAGRTVRDRLSAQKRQIQGGSLMTICVDHSHLRGFISGLERVTLELFSSEGLNPFDVEILGAKGLRDMILLQQARLPARLAFKPNDILICPGFPPALGLYPFRDRVIPYIHDLFLITRWPELSFRAKAYMSGPFRLMIKTYPVFLANSEATVADLRRYCRPDAKVQLLRPPVRNIFNLKPRREERRAARQPNVLRMIALGTVEPRKNYGAAARILSALRARGLDATLSIIGRPGWGPDVERLASAPGVTLRGYLEPAEARAAFEQADVLLNTSFDEGIGLPLLEAQFSDLAIVAPDKAVFREVLNGSALLVDTEDAEGAASAIVRHVAAREGRRTYAENIANVRRWNAAATRDREQFSALLAEMARETAPQTERSASEKTLSC